MSSSRMVTTTQPISNEDPQKVKEIINMGARTWNLEEISHLITAEAKEERQAIDPKLAVIRSKNAWNFIKTGAKHYTESSKFKA
ncbi:putative ribonuclease H protein [Corchorus olitorius]|uniref:Ribonuclease H protein n=1 Tax=Corchorus olitorius TaxID=93759 RepID=A0A1R3KLR4_9ROSI|nr:putative ribonuclease H protein [Corchorus olitorius]